MARVERAAETEGSVRGEGTIFSDMFHIPSYTFIYLYIPSYTFIFPQIATYTFIYPMYFKIINIRKMRIIIRPKNGDNSGPRASPKVII